MSQTSRYFFVIYPKINKFKCFLIHVVSGEVALPGGKREEGDANDVETALREAKEEIGLDPSLVTVVTVLEPFASKVTVCLVSEG